MDSKVFGERVKRIEDPAFLRGQGRYVDDIKLTDMVSATFVRSPFPHARLKGIDKSAAEVANEVS